jgi:hypothetical protein
MGEISRNSLGNLFSEGTEKSWWWVFITWYAAWHCTGRLTADLVRLARTFSYMEFCVSVLLFHGTVDKECKEELQEGGVEDG